MDKQKDNQLIDDYIITFPEDAQNAMNQIANLLRKLLPNAQEKISYKMPTFYEGENLIHFAGYKKHIGFYPTPSVIFAFKDELTSYKWAKGSVQFPLSDPMPLDLIKRMTEFRKNECLTKKKKK